MKWGREKCFKMGEGNDGAQNEDGFGVTQVEWSIGGASSSDGETSRETCFVFFVFWLAGLAFIKA